jgi:DNA-binding transcriptional MerR regulator
MPYKEPKIEKVFYTIGELAVMFNVNTSLIRFWDKEFTSLKPTKNKKGNRLFTPKDLEHFRLIYHLVKEKGNDHQRRATVAAKKQGRNSQYL